MSHAQRQRGRHDCLNPKCPAWWWCANPDCDGLDRPCTSCQREEELAKARRVEKGCPAAPVYGSRDDEGTP